MGFSKGILNQLVEKILTVFPALGHRNFRYFWFGQCISLIGTWMQNTGQSWFVYTLTNRPLMVGLVSMCQFTPMLLFSLFAGVVIDKFPKRKILLFTQTSAMLLALTLGILALTGTVRYWHILILATLLGIVNTLDMPTRQSFVIELVGKEDLLNAIALNSTVFNLARIVGPAIAGIAMGLWGPAFCFLANSLSFVAVIFGLFMIKTRPFVRKENANKNIFKDIKAGVQYIFSTPILLTSVTLTAIIGTFAMNYNVLIPVLARKVLHQEGMGYGFLMSAMGLGSLIGALTVATRSKKQPKLTKLFISGFVVSCMLLIIPLSNIYALTALLIMITGFFNINFSTTSNSTVQINSKDEFRGRVMSVYTLVFAGTTPIGSFIVSNITDKFGPRVGFVVSGLITMTLILTVLAFKRKAESKSEAGVLAEQN